MTYSFYNDEQTQYHLLDIFYLKLYLSPKHIHINKSFENKFSLGNND